MRAMRRKDRLVTASAKIERILMATRIVHLGLVDDGRPYVVPLHYCYGLSVVHSHLLADRRQADFGRGALEEQGAVALLEFFERHRERRLADVAFFGGAPEMTFARQGHDVAEFGQGHRGAIRR